MSPAPTVGSPSLARTGLAASHRALVGVGLGHDNPVRLSSVIPPGTDGAWAGWTRDRPGLLRLRRAPGRRAGEERPGPARDEAQAAVWPGREARHGPEEVLSAASANRQGGAAGGPRRPGLPPYDTHPR